MPNRPTRPYLDFKNWQGLATKPIPTALKVEQLLIAQNVDYFKAYGGVAKCKGSSRVLSSVYTEGGTTKTISWIGFYKYLDSNGEQLRRVLINAGTTLQRVNTSTGALTSLASGRVDGLIHAHDTPLVLPPPATSSPPARKNCSADCPPPTASRPPAQTSAA